MIPSLLLLLRRLLLLMGFYTLLRLGFYLSNYATFRGIDLGPVLLAFGHGFRFDISAILMLNLPFMLLSVLLPLQWRAGQQGLRALCVLLQTPGFAGNILDWEYFKFIGRRTSNELTTVGTEVGNQFGNFLINYWALLLLCLGLLALLWRLFPMPVPRKLKVKSYELKGEASGSEVSQEGLLARAGLLTFNSLLTFSLKLLLVAGLTILGIRGGWQLKPLRPGTAFQQTPTVLGHLALNSTFTLIKGFDAEVVERKQYFPNQAALRAALRIPTPPARPKAPLPAATNVVLLLLESFASEYTGVENGGQGGYTPFFDSLATAPGSVLLRENYANGRRSIEALPAVLAGLPSLLDTPFITSPFQTNELHGLAETLGRRGYATAIYHGGANGTMGFDMFSGLAGVQRYYGLNEYPGGAGSPDYDGHWGIFDEPYLQYFNQQLSRTKEPFFATVFTLSSHEPFALPRQYAGRFPKGTLPIHPTIAYADLALRRFFQAARRQPWFGHTLFVLTADHTSQSDHPDYQNPLGAQKTPLLLLAPGRTLPPLTDPRRISQQADVPATVLDLLLGPPAGRAAGLPFGASVFGPGPGRALFRSGESYFLVHPDFVTELTADNVVRLYPYRTHFMPHEPLANPDPAKLRQYGDELRACVQLYVNGLVDNKLYK
ncbi:LTA synthase family protein [uncultured Hymenobacter sp.]|uniref:LTA synthase family protein n=1 Tax=uncultured Hymenobacter sp. TaxID=170016 RepID=UPI0035CBD516